MWRVSRRRGEQGGGEELYLVVAEPDLAVGDGEVEDVVDKGLCSPGSFGNGKDLSGSRSGQCGRSSGTALGRTWVRTSLMTKRWGASSKALSKTTMGLLPLRQLPVIFISSMVWALRT